uniref:Uncharacterized protein n=1 Tax=Nelumbo nucifera TaxID=4432 RepID=A0A822ZNU5_NELNU|nr:TPA_asm: hypothetical protein HUJ06_016410 [Nelumbo nucifera]
MISLFPSRPLSSPAQQRPLLRSDRAKADNSLEAAETKDSKSELGFEGWVECGLLQFYQQEILLLFSE